MLFLSVQDTFSKTDYILGCIKQVLANTKILKYFLLYLQIKIKSIPSRTKKIYKHRKWTCKFLKKLKEIKNVLQSNKNENALKQLRYGKSDVKGSFIAMGTYIKKPKHLKRIT